MVVIYVQSCSRNEKDITGANLETLYVCFRGVWGKQDLETRIKLLRKKVAA